MIRIVVEENKFFGAAFHYNVDSFTPVAVSPALFARGVFFRKILRVVNEHVSAFSQLADALIKHRIAGLIVRGVNNDFALSFHAEAQTALRMVEPHGLHGAAFKLSAAFVDGAELAVRGHVTHVHGEIWVGHLFFKRLLQTARAAGRVKDERAIAIVIQRRKKRDALDVVPVKVRKKNVRVDRVAIPFLGKLLAQVAESGAAIENVNVPVDADFNTRGIAPVTQVF